MKYILTGATGYIGSNLARKLVEEGNDVNVIIREKSSLELIEDIKSRINIFVYNSKIESLISLFKKVEADVVIHLASLFISEHKSLEVNKLIESNIKFSTEILEAMKESSTKCIINTGTSWQHFENDSYNPVCLYAATKEAFESIIEYYAQSHNIKCITLELFDSYGPNDNRPKLLNLLERFSKEESVLSLSPGEQILDLVHISDIVEGYLVAINRIANKNDNKKEKYVLSSGNRVKLKDLIELYELVTGRHVSVIWGAREYRKREVMIPWEYGVILPHWKAKITLKEGLETTFST